MYIIIKVFVLTFPQNIIATICQTDVALSGFLWIGLRAAHFFRFPCFLLIFRCLASLCFFLENNPQNMSALICAVRCTNAINASPPKPISKGTTVVLNQANTLENMSYVSSIPEIDPFQYKCH